MIHRRSLPLHRLSALGALVVAGLWGGAGDLGAQEGENRGRDAVVAPDGSCISGRIGRIRVDNQPVFIAREGDPRALRWLYDFGNLLHVRTRPSFVRKELLFEEGDCYDPFLLSESARLLDAYGFLSDVRVEATDGPDGKIVDVQTRDEWSTRLDFGVTYDDGLNVESFRATEENFLGYGIHASAHFRERREERTRSLGISTPRLFGRTNAGFTIGEARGGSFFSQGVGYHFVGEATDFSASESYRRGTEFFSYTTGDRNGLSNVLVPIRQERIELSAGRRFGDPGESIILGLSFERDLRTLNGEIESVFSGNFDDVVRDTAGVPARAIAQIQDRVATRLAAHFGTRRYRWDEAVGFDAVRDRQTIGIGWFAGVSLGRDLGLFQPEGVPAADDWYGRFHGSFGFRIGSSFFHGGSTVEAGWAGEGWRDLLAEIDLVTYARASWLPNQTIFFRASAGGGWRTTMPFQLALGGRNGIRSLRDDQIPGGRRLVFTLEDRIRLDWPSTSAIDLGLTLLADAGRIWAGDAPFGSDSEWFGSVGVGLRIGTPSGTRNIWRPDIVFPIGRSGGPIFRVTFELNRMRSGFVTPKLGRSRRFVRGPEHF